jgi:hypothetical protein
MKRAIAMALAGAIAAACTGTIDDGGGLASGGGDAAAPDAWRAADGPTGGGGDAAVDPTDGPGASDDGASAPSSDGATASVDAGGTGVVCQTSVDSYGYMRCTCAQGVAALGDAGVASCAGFPCCVRYGADSGLAAGFGDPALSSGLCGCFQSADITAILGASATCGNFANDGVGVVVPSCP